ncbi:MAG: hypothetical protein ACP5O8_02480, partial [Candidatus Aenigmatarchaeota archaeon]
MKAQFGITETILIVGVLIASGITVYQLMSFYKVQTTLTKEEVVIVFAKDLEAIIDKATATTGDVAFVYSPPLVKYCVKIENNTVFVHDKNLNKNVSFSKQTPEIVSNYFEDSKKITIIKKGNKIFVMGRCLEEGESCSFSLACCSGFCWGSNGYTCKQNCAPNGEKAPDSLACCSKYLNASKQCDNPPLCPQESICPGSNDPGLWVDSQGRVCCPLDRSICSENHCCPPDKPKWCKKPKNGEERCMSEDEYEAECKKIIPFVILAIQMNSPVPNFNSLAQTCRDTWATVSPLKNCPDVVSVIAENKICQVNDECDAFPELLKCAKDWGYSGKYTRIVGIKHGSDICEPQRKGYTLKNYEVVVTVDDMIGTVCSHEFGHTFGLCDEGYGNSLCAGCDSGICDVGGRFCSGTGHCCPNRPEQNSIMC